MAKKTHAPLKDIVEAAEDRHAEDLVILKLAELCSFCDYFVICHGLSSVQVRAIADGIGDSLRKHRPKVFPLHVEGHEEASWILMDYGDVIVHVFDEPTRDFYRLERLWAAAPRVEPGELGVASPTPDAAAG